MVFSSMVFLWLFLSVVFILSRLWKDNTYQNILLLIASLFFYAWGEPVYVLLLLASVAVNFVLGLIMERIPKYRLFVLIAGVLFNILSLFCFKYTDFFINTFNHVFGTGFPMAGIRLPIGISFFTFQALSYVIDLYRGKFKAQRNILNLALYIAFFPQLIAGPIVRYEDIEKQLHERHMDAEKTAEGIRRFIYGLGKKVLIANNLAPAAEAVFGTPHEEIGFLLAWAGAAAYALQLYYDFSGYSDMAIGMAKMFGFELKENFDHPLISRNIGEFWRRWHISLGAWFREYVYFPLGGSKKGTARTCLNLMIVFALTGLWHGASWNFVGWGMLHGIFSVFERLGLKKYLDKTKIISRLYVFILFAAGFVTFHEGSFSSTVDIWLRMAGIRHAAAAAHPMTLFEPLELCVLAAAVFDCEFSSALAEFKGGCLKKKWVGSMAECLFLCVVMFLSLAAISGDAYNPFIYFRF